MRRTSRWLSPILAALLLGMIFAQEPDRPKKYALLVGVNKYNHAEMNRPQALKFAEADVSELARILKESGYECDILTGNEATCEAIYKKLDLLRSKGNADGVVLVALAGHGVQFEKDDDAYYCPFDCAVREAERDGKPVVDGTGTPILEPDPTSCVKLTDIVSRFRVSPAGRRVLLADCCRNDPTAGRGGRGVGAAIKTDRLPPNTAILLSCEQGQRSWEDPKWGHGAFFYHVLNGIRTGEAAVANAVGTGSLSTYLSRKVPADVAQVIGKGAEQKPHPIANGDVDLGLIVKTISAKPPLDEVEPPFTRMPTRFTRDEALKMRTWYARRTRVEPVFQAAGVPLLLIPPGEVQTGSQERMEDLLKVFIREDVLTLSKVSPSRVVPIRSGFYIGRTEVTVAQFRQFVKETDYKTDQEANRHAANPTEAKAASDDSPWHKADRDGGDEDHPVTRVTCNDALEFCQWLSRKTGKRCRLPTPDEWEYVCHAGTQTRYWTGDDPDSLVRGANVPDIKRLQRAQESKDFRDGHLEYRNDDNKWTPFAVSARVEIKTTPQGGYVINEAKTITDIRADHVFVVNESRHTVAIANAVNQWTLRPGDTATIPQIPNGKNNYLQVNDGYAGLAPVGSYEPNNFGVYDTHGNVWEYCRDNESGKDVFVIRGGCYL